MTRHSYIDESGTKDDQEVMALALIVLEGGFTAAKIHKHLIGSLNPKYLDSKKVGGKLALHYADMSKEHKRTSGLILASYSVDCFASYYYHDGSEKTHGERHFIYSNLVKNCVSQALQVYDELEVSIAQQGDWQSYAIDLINELQGVVSTLSRRYQFKKAKFDFLSAAKPGIQLADYYVGAVRGHLLKHSDESLGTAFDLIQHQVRELQMESEDLASKAKERD